MPPQGGGGGGGSRRARVFRLHVRGVDYVYITRKLRETSELLLFLITSGE